MRLSAENLFSMEGKVVLLTGGAGYLATTMAVCLLENGAKVAIADKAEKLHESLHGWQDAGDCVLLHCDLASTESIRKVISNVLEQFGTLDVLVNAAVYSGGYGPADTKIESISDEVWQIGIDGAVGTAFRCTREVLPHFYETGSGVIVNVGSMYGLVSPDPKIYATSGQNNPPSYGAGKAAVHQFSRYCAAHLADRNIRVNTIIPGPHPNPAGMTDDDFYQALCDKTMMGRVGIPKDLAGALLLLCSDASAFMTGSSVTVDGGWTAW